LPLRIQALGREPALADGLLGKSALTAQQIPVPGSESESSDECRFLGEQTSSKPHHRMPVAWHQLTRLLQNGRIGNGS
jgi:hypothetical protein